VCEINVTVKWGKTLLSSVICHEDKGRRSVSSRHFAKRAQLWSNRRRINTRRRCDIFLILGGSRADSPTSFWCWPGVDVFRWQQQCLPLTWNTTSTALGIAGRLWSRWRYHNFKGETTALGEPTRYGKRSGSIQTDGRRNTACRLIGSLRLFAEFTVIFRGLSSECVIWRKVATSTRCGWSLFTQNSVDRRSHGWGYFQNPQQKLMRTGYSRSPASWSSSLL